MPFQQDPCIIPWEVNVDNNCQSRNLKKLENDSRAETRTYRSVMEIQWFVFNPPAD